MFLWEEERTQRQSRSLCEDGGRTGIKAPQVKECLRPPETRKSK